MSPRVQVFTESSWICRRLATHLDKLPGFDVQFPARPGPSAVTYYVPYLFREHVQPTGVSVGMFTHFEEGNHKARFDRLARRVDWCVCLSEQHRRYLEKLRPGRVRRMRLPVETKVPRKLIVGWFHRSPTGYGSRKRTDLVEVAEKTDWIELRRSRCMGTVAETHADMRQCDVLLTTSDYESGPVSLLESMALGIPHVIPAGVGLADEYADEPLVSTFRRGDAESMILALRELYLPMLYTAQAVKGNTVENWRRDHAHLFAEILA